MIYAPLCAKNRHHFLAIGGEEGSYESHAPHIKINRLLSPLFLLLLLPHLSWHSSRRKTAGFFRFEAFLFSLPTFTTDGILSFPICGNALGKKRRRDDEI